MSEKEVTFAVRMMVTVTAYVSADADEMDPDMAGELAEIVSVQSVVLPSVGEVSEAIGSDPDAFDDAVAEAWGAK